MVNGDFDSDTMLITNNELLVEAAKKNYDRFKVPTNFVQAKKTQRFYSAGQMADLDIKTSVNKIGEIVNLSQQLNSIYWDRIAAGQTFEENAELYNDICKLAVLSNIEIDRAKKEFIIDSGKEIRMLKEKYLIVKDGRQVKPMFFKMITQENGYKLTGRIYYTYFNTSMDYLHRILSSYKTAQGRKKSEYIPFVDIIRKPAGYVEQGYYYEQKNRIVNIIRETRTAIKAVYADYDTKPKEEREVVRKVASDLKQECVEYINDISISEASMYLLLKDIESPAYKDISRFMFEVLFGTPNKTFFKLIIDSRETLKELIEVKRGEVALYSYYFTKKNLLKSS